MYIHVCGQITWGTNSAHETQDYDVHVPKGALTHTYMNVHGCYRQVFIITSSLWFILDS